MFIFEFRFQGLYESVKHAKETTTSTLMLNLDAMKTVVQVLQERVVDTPEKMVYLFLDERGHEDTTVTMAGLDRAARKVAATLERKHHLVRGDRVLLCYPPGTVDFAFAFWGCLYAGAIAVPVAPPNPASLATDLPRFNRMVEDTEAKIVLTTRKYYVATQVAKAVTLFSKRVPKWSTQLEWVSTDAIADAMALRFTRPVSPALDDVAFLQYSSGSTSDPKAVIITHGNIVAQLQTSPLRFGPDTTMVSWLPHFHDFCLVVCTLVPCYIGFRCIFLSPLAFLKTPALWMQVVSKYRGTSTCGPNFGYALAARKTSADQVATLDLSSLTYCAVGAEPIRPASLAEFTHAFGPAGFNAKSFNCSYGMAEATLCITHRTPEESFEPIVISVKKSALEIHRRLVLAPFGHPKEDTKEMVGCGSTLPTFNVKVVDPDTHHEGASNHVGEIWIRGPSVGKGYWKRDVLTQDLFHAELKSATDDDQRLDWFRTGDLGVWHQSQLFVTERLKDLIIIRGRNVSPQDIEHTVELAHCQVRAGCVAAFSVENASTNEENLVVVSELRVKIKDTTQLAVIAHDIALAVLRDHQLASAVIALLPPRAIAKTTSGKIQRRLTKQHFEFGTLVSPQYIWRAADGGKPTQPQTSHETSARTTSDPSVALEAWLRAYLAKRGDKTVDMETTWACYGIDSVAMVELCSELGSFLGCVVPPEALFKYDTPAKLMAVADTCDWTALRPSNQDDRPDDLLHEYTDIESDCYDIAAFPEAKELQSHIDTMAAAGLRFPYLEELTLARRMQTNYNTYNYLGYASDPRVIQAATDALQIYGATMSSSPVVGQHSLLLALEASLSQHFQAEAAVVFVSGWVTNVAAIEALVGPSDLILCDVLNHNSCVHGQRLSGATVLAFPHNDVAAARRMLENVRHKFRRVLLVIEGLYSMDGDVPDLAAFVALKKTFKCLLYVDEAHSLGVLGETGRGVCEYAGVDPADIDVRMGSMSKAMGSVGGFLLGSAAAMNFFRLRAGGFVYSVGLSPPNAAAAVQAVQCMGQEPYRTTQLHQLALFFYDACVHANLDLGSTLRGGAVVVVHVGATAATVRASARLSEQYAINVRPIVAPAVEEGKGRLRFFLSVLQTQDELQRTVYAVARVLANIQDI
ncbi:Aste57867_8954 [Aphanomyces stellatus]|uniref:Aste57867_8954 protein n=1 Tax=Aphanomyces stellatus TaxID=120398 RepID=A0A485KLJ4_9STRA|nr:hypothetical protein As57867_008919 [Aphanomyces stellatus]VFT85838.1 Aste57867_8954 [Aphanomyces stellatus]